MLIFLFVEEGKLFIKMLAFEEFNVVFFTAERMMVCSLKCQQPRQRRICWIFRYILHSLAKKITFLKGNVCTYICFKDFFFGGKEKLQNASRFEMDFVLNFCHVADFTCMNRSTIQLVLDSVRFFFFSSLFIHKISSKHDGDITASNLNLILMFLTLHAMSGSVFGHFSIRS